MKWQNETPLQVLNTTGPGPGGSVMSFIVKGTFDIREGGPATLAEQQVPVLLVDENVGGNPMGSVRLENDLAPFKPRTDLVLVGSAHSPNGRAVTELNVGLRVGSYFWALQVTGNRHWSFPNRLALSPSMSLPEPFVELPIVYERAFGGADKQEGMVYPFNPVGTGYAEKGTPSHLHGKALPNFSGVNEPITAWNQRPRPAGFGFIGRLWQPRAAKSAIGPNGEFDFGFYNAAHPELQVPWLSGDEEVELRHLTPGGRLNFRLPGLTPRLEVKRAPGWKIGEATSAIKMIIETLDVELRLDTVIVLPDENRLLLTWRGVVPISDPASKEIIDVRLLPGSREQPARVAPDALPVPPPRFTAPVGTDEPLTESQKLAATQFEETLGRIIVPGPDGGAVSVRAPAGPTTPPPSAPPPKSASPATETHIPPPASPAPVGPAPVSPPPANPAPPPAGFGALRPDARVAGRYLLKRLIGKGAHAEVWEATDEELHTPVALKFISEELVDLPEAVEDLGREIRNTSTLSHPNIVRTLGFVQAPGLAAIAMDYVEGNSLRHFMNDRPSGCFEVEHLTGWVESLIGALDYAHGEPKIVHRDLKPGNLLLDAGGNIRVADFGLSACINETATRLTGTRPPAGTLAYMSPQQILGQPPTPADDVYSLGATLFDLLTGTPPFYSGNLIDQILKKLPPKVAERRQELNVRGAAVPNHWENALAACLAKDPRQRPARIRDVLGLLRLGAESAAEEAPGVPAPGAAPAGSETSVPTTPIPAPPAAATAPPMASPTTAPPPEPARAATAPLIETKPPEPVVPPAAPPRAPEPPTGVTETVIPVTVTAAPPSTHPPRAADPRYAAATEPTPDPMATHIGGRPAPPPRAPVPAPPPAPPPPPAASEPEPPAPPPAVAARPAPAAESPPPPPPPAPPQKPPAPPATPEAEPEWAAPPPPARKAPADFQMPKWSVPETAPAPAAAPPGASPAPGPTPIPGKRPPIGFLVGGGVVLVALVGAALVFMRGPNETTPPARRLAARVPADSARALVQGGSGSTRAESGGAQAESAGSVAAPIDSGAAPATSGGGGATAEPTVPEPTPEERIARLRDAIPRNMGQGRFDRAARRIDDLLKLAPGDAQALKWRAGVQAAQAKAQRDKESVTRPDAGGGGGAYGLPAEQADVAAFLGRFQRAWERCDGNGYANLWSGVGGSARQGLVKTFEGLRSQNLSLSGVRADIHGGSADLRFAMRRRITWSDGRATTENRQVTMSLSRSGKGDWKIQRLQYR